MHPARASQQRQHVTAVSDSEPQATRERASAMSSGVLLRRLSRPRSGLHETLHFSIERGHACQCGFWVIEASRQLVGASGGCKQRRASCPRSLKGSILHCPRESSC